VALIALSQLPDHIKLRTSLAARELAFAVVNQFIHSLNDWIEVEEPLLKQQSVDGDIAKLL
jgi:hypothetical protein